MSDKSILFLDKEHRKFTKSGHEQKNIVGWSAAAEMSNYPHKVILDILGEIQTTNLEEEFLNVLKEL